MESQPPEDRADRAREGVTLGAAGLEVDISAVLDRLPPVAEQVGLAVRQHRRELGVSQRAYAEQRGLSKSAVARLESAAGRVRLEDVVQALSAGGFALFVLQRDSADPTPTPRVATDPPRRPRWSVPVWRVSDLLARTRWAGRRFPAHAPVQLTEMGPLWWWTDEMMRTRRRLGEQPRWTAEGARTRGNWLRSTFEYTMPPVEDPPGSERPPE